jgi:hypothetical protein
MPPADTDAPLPPALCVDDALVELALVALLDELADDDVVSSSPQANGTNAKVRNKPISEVFIMGRLWPL